MALADEVVRLCEQPNHFKLLYDLDMMLEKKI
jgi:formyltetrahydrofolate synthetase